MVSSTLRFLDQHRLEAALQGRVLFDVLAVLVQGGGADAVQLAAGQHRLEHVAGVHGPFGLARADDGVEFVDEQQDPALGLLDLLEHGLEPLLELAAVLGSGDERAHVQGQDPLVLEPSGTSCARCAGPGPPRWPSCPRPASPMRTGLFLVRRERMRMQRRISASRPMTGSSLPLPGLFHQVAAVLLRAS
jgi:hypothetical protein